ncbi:hypothetical protein BN1723_017579 [Verticillium longisporum]|uniref:Uncharacterized protein n=1 Tax=Verticillium longisporum TaxID=100787 RepID=A0A0G4L7C6_VERLO|nr:hypothetical protein BN1723_017579 [Verticillium longisporum]CRK40131.1 hypothetical protein BN1708_016774 [Verticillium longisporum]
MTSSGLGPALSSNTNPFTSSELQFRGNTAAAGAGPASQAASGIPSGFRLTTIGSEPMTLLPPTLAKSRPSLAKRLSISFDYLPLDGTGSARRHRVVLGASSNMNGGRSVNKFAIVQSSKCGSYGVDLHFRLFFDPGTDRMVIFNLATKQMTARSICDMTSNMEIELEPYSPTMLDAGSWAIFTPSGRHALDFSILLRRHVVISKAPPQDLAPRAISSKRPLEISQPLDSATRGKYDDDKQAEEGIVRSTMIIFQSVPVAPLIDISASTTGQGYVVPLVAHPLEQLRMGDKACITGPVGEEYAQHSQLPGDIAVVKVIRTPSYDIQLGASDPSAMQISRAAEMWLKEYKNHSKLSQQTTVVRIHEAYARFLSLYMEHVDAPALASCRGQDPNPMCT